MLPRVPAEDGVACFARVMNRRAQTCTLLVVGPISRFRGGGYIRPDGVVVHDMRLTQIKTPAQSTTR